MIIMSESTSEDASIVWTLFDLFPFLQNHSNAMGGPTFQIPGGSAPMDVGAQPGEEFCQFTREITYLVYTRITAIELPYLCDQEAMGIQRFAE